ncbi:hypothetical protein [Trabulsiella odontotermitis]|uniref:hypothetical protein n=1 Tax=Trabulsiella odontotermitis TaxID=379893 RepID=UPI0006BA0E7E|nr:hypothetical protein [Trabulsiella odontotermitis]
MSTIILMEPRRAADCGQQLKFIAEALDLRQIDLAHVYQIDRQDLGKAYHGQKMIPARCVHAHMLLLELAHRRVTSQEVA